MATLPDQVLGWLYNNLKANYRELDRCYSDIVQTLLQYPSLQPRTEIYTFDNGASALLLVLRGTVPVAFRGTSYRYPIAIWIQYGFPHDAPIVFVSPTQDMVVRPGQHVSVDGRVYHPYIANWQAQWEGSNLPALLNVLKDVFSKEPPVMARQASANGSRPPPIPPPPRTTEQQTYPTRSSSISQNGPPPPPPKSSGMPSASSHQRSSSGTSDYASRGAPSLPPKPGQERDRPLHTQIPQSLPMSSQYTMGPLSAHQRGQSDGGRPPPPLPHELRQAGQPHPSMNSPGPRYDMPMRPRQNPPPPQQVQAGLMPQTQSTSNYAPQASIYPPNSHPPPSQPQPPYTNPQYTQPPLQQAVQSKKPILDLLSASNDTPLPSQTATTGNTPFRNGPPIPRNPKKDALLHAISQALHPQLIQLISQNTSALSSLTAQHTALLSAQAAMHAELSSLQNLSTTLTNNEHALHTAISAADAQIAALASRELPNIDEVLVAPTVVGEQLYRLVAEERGIAEAMFVLGRALDRGRVGSEVFVRLMRGLARERFERKVLVGKIARGLGLNMGVGVV